MGQQPEDVRQTAFPTLPFPEQGRVQTDILKELGQRLEQDLTYLSGRVLGAMTTQPHSFAARVYAQYLERNLGDAGLVPATQGLEQEVIAQLGAMLGEPQALGNLMSGGTEANIVAMRLVVKSAAPRSHPEVVVPDSAHFSFDKAADLLGFRIQRARLNPDFSLDLDHYRSLINENTIALVVVAGTTSLGLVDPIPEIAAVAREQGLFLHVDGAFGSFVLPFLRDLGHNLPAFDMATPGISSYTVDPHKMGGGVIPGGALLVRNASLLELGYKIPYLAGGGRRSLALTGTRPGAAAISFWALLQHMGRQGFIEQTRRCWENTQFLYQALQQHPRLKPAVPPLCNVLGIMPRTPDDPDPVQMDQELRKAGWALALFRRYGLLRFVAMPHVQREHVENFLNDLERVLG